MAFNNRHYDPVLLNEMLMNQEDYKNKIGFIALENRMAELFSRPRRPLSVYSVIGDQMYPLAIYNVTEDRYTFPKNIVSRLKEVNAYCFGVHAPVVIYPRQQYRRYHPLRSEMFAIEHSDSTVTNYWRSKPEHALENLMPFIKQKPSYFGAVDNGRYADDRDGDSMKNLTQLIPEINGRTILDYIHASKGLFDKPIRSKYQGTRKKASKRKGN